VSEEEDAGLWLTRITIERRLTNDGDNIEAAFEDRDGNMPPLYEVLGMLTLTQDTAIRRAMSEVPDEDDDED
jgi:hypothetical protein